MAKSKPRDGSLGLSQLKRKRRKSIVDKGKGDRRGPRGLEEAEGRCCDRQVRGWSVFTQYGGLEGLWEM